MATIQNSIQLRDGMSNVLHNIYTSVNTVIAVFEDMQRTTGQAIDVVKLQEARTGLGQVEAAARQIDGKLQAAERSQKGFNNQIRKGRDAADGLLGRVRQFVGIYAGIRGIKMGIQFVADTISLQNVQTEAETKLQGIMQQRMGAGPEAIQSIKDLTSAQQKLGVVGDELQLMGAQQLATFLHTGSALSTLVPAMNNLAVQQNGVKVSAEAMTNIGNMMGKVMQGQVGALTRVGVTFTEAQEKILKYGNEQERAATLAEVITDNVGNMNAIIAATPQGQIKQIANTWGDIKEAVGARLYPAVLRLFQAFNSGMPRAEALVMGLAGALSVVINALSLMVDGAGAVVGFFQDNWSWIEPIIWGIIAALVVYNATAGITWLTNLKDAAANLLKAGASGVAAVATFAQTVAQKGLNAALYACPITWIIIGIIALIAIFYAAVGAVNKFKGTAISATGLIGGAIAVWAAGVMNQFIYVWNVVADFVNFFYNVWNDPIAAVKVLFLDLSVTVIGYMQSMARGIEGIINKIPGVHVDITSGAEQFKQKIEGMAADVKSKSGWEEIVKKKEHIDYGDAAKTGYRFGSQIEGKVKDVFGGIKDVFDGGPRNEWEGIGQHTGDTAANTAAMADSMDVLDEDLKYMRDAAEQEIINRFTLAELKVDVKNSNTLTKKTDFDDMGRALASFTNEFLAAAAEGGHL